jgi:hypothetical protein
MGVPIASTTNLKEIGQRLGINYRFGGIEINLSVRIAPIQQKIKIITA